jgi:biotin operon repressor/protein involved in ribonucleotide reduction
MGKQLAKNLLDPSIILGFILKGLLSVNKAQTDYTRETGHSIDTVDTLNTSLITTSDYIKAATELTRQFGLAADVIFTKETLQEATEMVELMGMSNEEAGKLARLSKVSGTELKDNNEKIMASYSNFVKLNKTGISAKSVFKDVSNVSDAIALSLGGSTEAIAKSVMEAKKLGLTLEQVDKIAESLLNFEDSISSELEAELLTGKQLNLEQARYYALTNNIKGLTKEIGNNQEILGVFSSGNRIQQDAIAKSMGLSREEMAKMIYDQKLASGLTAEQAANLADVSLEDMKRLSVQESITKSIEKMSEAFAPLLTFVAKYADIILSIVGAYMTLNTLMKAQQIMQGIAVGLEIHKRGVILSGNAARAAGNVLAGQELAKQVAITTAKIAGSPWLLPGVGAALAVGALIYASMNKTPKLKDGGTVIGEGSVMVGEQGPEVLSLKPGATVTPLSKVNAASMGGGGNSKELTEIKNILSQILNKDANVYMDSTKVGTSLNVGSVQIQ